MAELSISVDDVISPWSPIFLSTRATSPFSSLEILPNLLSQHCIRAPPKRGRYWEIHPRRPRDFESRGKSRLSIFVWIRKSFPVNREGLTVLKSILHCWWWQIAQLKFLSHTKGSRPNFFLGKLGILSQTAWPPSPSPNVGTPTTKIFFDVYFAF